MFARHSLGARLSVGAVVGAVVGLAGVALAVQAAPAVAATAVTHCPAAALKVTERDGGAGLSHDGVLLVFTNISKTTCTLTGYPKITLLDAAGRVVLHATPTRAGYLGGLQVGEAIPTASLPPREKAVALLEGVVVRTNGDACPVEHAIRVTSPQTFTLVRVSVAVGFCADIQVHPIVSLALA